MVDALYVGEDSIYIARGFDNNQEFEDSTVMEVSPTPSIDGRRIFGLGETAYGERCLSVAPVSYHIPSTRTTMMPAPSKHKIAIVFRAVAAVFSIWYSYTLICFVKNVQDGARMVSAIKGGKPPVQLFHRNEKGLTGVKETMILALSGW